MNEIKGFVGTYAPAKGIYSFLYDVQKDASVKTDSFHPIKDAKYLSYYKNRSTFPTQFVDARFCALADGRKLFAGLENSTVCYVIQGEDCVYTVNYHDGTLIYYRFSEEGLYKENIMHTRHEVGAHQAILTGATILVPCRLLDRVYVYGRTSMELIRAISSPKGTGIRHGVLDDHRRFLYMTSEDSCEVFEVNMGQGGAITKKLSLLKEGEQGGGVAIRINSSGETLYVSMHGTNQLYVIDTAQWCILQRISSGGDHPRDINLFPWGDYLSVADRSSGNLVAFKIDHISGMLEEKTHMDMILEGVDIVFYEQEETRMRMNNIGIAGLAVMGRSLVLNMADHGYKVGGYNRSYTMTRHMLEARPHENFTGHPTLEELVAPLKKLRRIMLMVKAGKTVDVIIEQLIPLLEQGNTILDGSNFFFEDTIRREAYLKGRGPHYFGVGISGGEDGARSGSSIMPGGSKAAYEEIRPILEAVVARVGDGTSCCTHTGENGAGYYVRMVHNGIEYADMQLIAEAYLLSKHVGHSDNAQLAETSSEYQKGKLNSFLIYITPDISREQDDKGGKKLVNCIRDVAQQKGTGRRTNIEALKQGVSVFIVVIAGNTRAMPNNESRKAAEKQYPYVEIAETSNPDASKEEVRQGLYVAKIIAYAQGFGLLKQISASYGWELPLGKTASIFRAGYTIQAKFLNDITRAYEQQVSLSHLLLDSFLQERVVSYEKNLRQADVQAILNGTPAPAMTNAISYLDLFRATHAGANLIQAQRDYFGAYTFEYVGEEGSLHHEWRRWAWNSRLLLYSREPAI